MKLETLFRTYIEENEAIYAPYYGGKENVLTTIRQEGGRLQNIPHLDFKKFGQSNDWQLSASDELFLTELLRDELLKWFVPKVLDVVKHFSEPFMNELLETAIRTSDPSFNREFINPCLRVFGLKAYDYLLARFEKSNKEEKKGILRAFYWTRFLFILNASPSTLEAERQYVLNGEEAFWEVEGNSCTYAVKHVWNGDHWSGTIMNEAEYFPYKDMVLERLRKQYELLLDEFLKEGDLDMKYFISLALPKHINIYPEELKGKAELYLKQVNQVPDNIVDLVRIKKVRSPLLRIVLQAYLKWKNKWLGRGRITRKY